MGCLPAVGGAGAGPGGRVRARVAVRGASRDETFGLLRQWQALESRAAAGKLGVLRALIRDDDQPLPGGGHHGDLPAGWTKSLTHEVALTLSMPAVSADRLMWLAWDLEARLPGTGGLLAAGPLTNQQGQGDQRGAAAADRRGRRGGGSDDPAGAARQDLRAGRQARRRRRRSPSTRNPPPGAGKTAERNRSRVEMFREQSGAAALAGRELPTDQTLAANASVSARAAEYQESGAFPGGTRMDQYRVAAFLDLLNGVTAASGSPPGCCPAPARSASRSADGSAWQPAADAGRRVTAASPDGDGCPAANATAAARRCDPAMTTAATRRR